MWRYVYGLWSVVECGAVGAKLLSSGVWSSGYGVVELWSVEQWSIGVQSDEVWSCGAVELWSCVV